MKYKGRLPSNALLPYYPDGNGETGYNYQIKKLLEYCEISRKVAMFSAALGTNEYKSIYEIASSKLARKTHVDLMNKVQIDKYAAGLHAKGSGAVDRYTGLGIKERFSFMCTAFGCNQYEVDDDVSVMEDTLLFDTIPVVEPLRGFLLKEERFIQLPFPQSPSLHGLTPTRTNTTTKA